MAMSGHNSLYNSSNGLLILFFSLPQKRLCRGDLFTVDRHANPGKSSADLVSVVSARSGDQLGHSARSCCRIFASFVDFGSYTHLPHVTHALSCYQMLLLEKWWSCC